jgi:FdrA protein
MPILRSEVRRGAYYDSVVLMQLQRGLLGLPGVLDAGAVMATPVNLELLDVSGLRPAEAPSADDLLIVVKAADEQAAADALAQVDALLARRRVAADADFRPKSLAAAARQFPDAAWVLISVPGRFAAGVAREALSLGKSVFLYSDNVPIEDEVSLKRQAADQGLMIMGPDCGTAIIGGFGLGFANRVRRGVIGLVGASGTGLQTVTSAIHARGGGVSQAIGTGGRDLHSEVGGLTAHQALDVLRRDPATEVIVVLSKPPDGQVAGRLVSAARRTGKPVVLDLVGAAGVRGRLGNLHFAAGLEDAAEIAVSLAGSPPALASGARARSTSGRYLRALFSGGTIAYEAVVALQFVLSPLLTNVPLREDQRLEDPLQSRGHTLLDLGADAFTIGRLHPMIDNDLRLRRLRQEATDPETAVVLLDVVLGEGAHPNPAAEIAPAVAEALRRPGLAVVAVVIGTPEDPQGLDAQVERLRAAGAEVFPSLQQALDAVVADLPLDEAPWPRPVPLESFAAPAAINVGLESFYDSLLTQGARAVHVDWKPPAGGDERLMGILARMKGGRSAGNEAP